MIGIRRLGLELLHLGHVPAGAAARWPGGLPRLDEFVVLPSTTRRCGFGFARGQHGHETMVVRMFHVRRYLFSRVVGPAVVGGAAALVTEGIMAHAMTYYAAISACSMGGHMHRGRILLFSNL